MEQHACMYILQLPSLFSNVRSRQHPTRCYMMYSWATVALFLSILLRVCPSFRLQPSVQFISPQLRLASLSSRRGNSLGRSYVVTRVGLSRISLNHLYRPTTYLSGSEQVDGTSTGGGGKENGDVDYSADALTGFLGKFLPGKGESNQPQAKDLVSWNKLHRDTGSAIQ